MTALSAEQRELRSVVRRFLDDTGPDDPALWKRMGTELGLQGLAVPASLGGSGATWVEAGVVAEELGRALAAGAYVPTLMAQAGLADEAARERWLPGLADGSVTGAVAWEPVLARDGRLTGTTRGVPAADLVLVPAADGLYAVESPAAQAIRPLDETRPLVDLVLDATPAVRVGNPAAAIRVGTVLLACEEVGGIAACLDLSVAYARTREQFGRPIGSFQAVKHRLADMLVLAETARSAAYAALALLGSPDDVVWRIAGSVCGDAYRAVASSAVQVHGGIGFTAEHVVGRHVKRSRASAALLGTPAEHRRALAPHVLVGA